MSLQKLILRRILYLCVLRILREMAVKGECAWARVFIRESKHICRIERGTSEGMAKFGVRVLAERYKLYCEHFSEYPQFSMDQKEFHRVAKVVDKMFRAWRNRADKMAYLARFSPSNWNGGKIITKEGKTKHSLFNCSTCQLFNSSYQGTFPVPKSCRVHTRGPLSQIRNEAKKLTSEKPKITNKALKEVGHAIYSAFDERCKENFGKSFSEIMVLVPEAGLEKKKSPAEKKKMKRDQQREMKKQTEDKMAGDTGAHLILRQSYSARQNQRLAQAFETPQEAAERVKKTPPEKRNRSHTPALDNIDGDLDKLQTEVESWSDKINWSEKAREYRIRMKGQDQVPRNGGQILKAFLSATGIDLARFQTTSGMTQNDLQGRNTLVLFYTT